MTLIPNAMKTLGIEMPATRTNFHLVRLSDDRTILLAQLTGYDTFQNNVADLRARFAAQGFAKFISWYQVSHT